MSNNRNKTLAEFSMNVGGRQAVVVSPDKSGYGIRVTCIDSNAHQSLLNEAGQVNQGSKKILADIVSSAVHFWGNVRDVVPTVTLSAKLDRLYGDTIAETLGYTKGKRGNRLRTYHPASTMSTICY